VLPGVDKPHVAIDSDILCGIFDDNRCFLKSDYADGYHRCVEYFYWTPDFPEIPIKQCQLILQAIQNKPSLRYFFDKNLTTPNERESDSFRFHRRNVLSEIVYPTWDLKTFQAIKSDSVVNSLHYQWATDIDDPSIESWRSSIRTRLKLIDDKYLDKKRDGTLRAYRSLYTRRPYPVGKLPKLKENH
jgi:hypothetical protein